MIRLADLLPYHGHVLPTGATSVSYSSDWHTQTVDFPGMGDDISIAVSSVEEDSTRVYWFSEQTHIPLGEIEDFKVEGRCLGACFSSNPFKGSTPLQRLTSWHTERLFELLYQDQGVGIPCPHPPARSNTLPLNAMDCPQGHSQT